MESNTNQIRTKADIELNPLCSILGSKSNSLKTVLRSIQTGSTVGNYPGRIILIINIHLLPQHLLHQVLVRGGQFQHGH